MDKSKVLIRIVDDDPTILKSVSLMLKYEGYNVECWGDALEFLKGDVPSKPGCIVLDIKMPGMTGIELQKLLVERGSETPIIFLTAHGDVEIAVESMKVGAVDFLQKPLNPKKFLDIIQKCVEQDLIRRSLGMESREVTENWKKLTEREKQISVLVAEDLSSKVIGNRLGVSKRTVENHRANLYKKLNLNAPDQLKNFVATIKELGIEKNVSS